MENNIILANIAKKEFTPKGGKFKSFAVILVGFISIVLKCWNWN
jgi:hypothetical protein